MSILVTDTFTGTGLLPSHTADTGQSWSKQFEAGDLVLTGTRVRNNASAAKALGISSQAPGSTEYDVQADYTQITADASASTAAFLCARFAGGGAALYYGGWNFDTLQWVIRESPNGSFSASTIASASGSITVGNVYTVKLAIRDASKTLFVNGVQVCTSANNGATAAGLAGIYLRTGITVGDSAGGQWDNFQMSTPATVYTQGVSGALSFAGSSVKAPSRRLTGAVSFSGATARAFSTPRMLAPASLRFVGGAALFPGLPLYPSPDTWPNPGEIFMTLNRQLNAAFQPHGVLSSGVALVRTVTAVLQPTGVLVKQTSRRLTAALQPVISAFTKTASTHAFTKLLTASLRASGQLTTARVLPPADGGGGYATPMSDDFFRRYKPTLRKQKQRV